MMPPRGGLSEKERLESPKALREAAEEILRLWDEYSDPHGFSDEFLEAIENLREVLE